MPGPRGPAPSPADRGTHGQLDELEELMQRMLALPVEGPVAPAPAPAEPTPPQPVEEHPPTESQNVLPPETKSWWEEEFEAALTAPEAPGADRAEEEPLASRELSVARTDLAAPERTPEDDQLLVFSLATKKETASAPRLDRPAPVLPAAPRRRVPLLLRPVLWCNTAYDAPTRLLGPLGRPLRGLFVRTVLGVVGLLLVVGSAAWVALELADWTW